MEVTRSQKYTLWNSQGMIPCIPVSERRVEGEKVLLRVGVSALTSG